jgi:hypothetical protein
LILVFWLRWVWLKQPVDALSMHEICAHQSGEGERTFDGFLRSMGKAEDQLGDQRYGDLDAYGIEGRTDQVANSEGLLNPAEEQLDGPAALVECGDLLRRELKIVAHKAQHSAFVGSYRHFAHRARERFHAVSRALSDLMEPFDGDILSRGQARFAWRCPASAKKRNAATG